MKLKFFPLFKDEGELIASWGQAQLIKYLDGRVELKDGSKEDRQAAQEWISLFWHEAVLRDDRTSNFQDREAGQSYPRPPLHGSYEPPKPVQ